jgi:tetratricopeptide (TPR) repeat protein
MARVRVLEVDDPRALGARLRAARVERGLSLRGLAFPGCTAAYISTIENGRRVPSLQVLNALASRLNVSADYIATGRDAPLSGPAAEAELMLRLGHVDQAEALFGELAAAGSPAERLQALGGLGLVALNRGDLPAGVALLEEAEELDREAFLAQPSLVEALGRSHATRGEYESAIALFTDARSSALGRGNRPAALKQAVLLANTYIDLGDPSRSSEVLADVLSELAELKDPRLRASVYWSQARLHTLERRHDLAAEFAERALETLRVAEDERTIAFAEQLLAYIEIERGNPGAALGLLDGATATIDRVAEPLERAVFHLERARALSELGQSEEALDILVEIAPTLRDSPRLDGGRYLIVLAEIYERNGNDDDALTMLGEAVERLSDHRNPHLVRALRSQGELLKRLGRTDEALDALQRALAIQDATAEQLNG